MHLRPLVVLMAALLGIPAASAQDAPQQTVDGAQRFIAVLAENGQLGFRADHYTWPRVGLDYRIDGAVAGPCITRITGQPRNYAFMDRGGQGSGWITVGTPQWNPNKFEELRAQFGLPTLPLTIDWSRVTSIGIVGYTNDLTNDDGVRRTVRVVWSGGFVALTMDDDALARRLEYAANFIKAACDRTAETGF